MLHPKGREIKKLLIEYDLNQKMLAEHLGITPQAVNNRIKRGSTELLRKAIEELRDE